MNKIIISCLIFSCNLITFSPVWAGELSYKNTTLGFGFNLMAGWKKISENSYSVTFASEKLDSNGKVFESTLIVGNRPLEKLTFAEDFQNLVDHLKAFHLNIKSIKNSSINGNPAKWVGFFDEKSKRFELHCLIFHNNRIIILKFNAPKALADIYLPRFEYAISSFTTF